MDISPKSQNTQDTVHRSHEAEEERRPKCGCFNETDKIIIAFAHVSSFKVAFDASWCQCCLWCVLTSVLPVMCSDVSVAVMSSDVSVAYDVFWCQCCLWCILTSVLPVMSFDISAPWFWAHMYVLHYVKPTNTVWNASLRFQMITVCAYKTLFYSIIVI